MEEYVVKDGKRLRLGYTTGSCAAAAAKAAAWMLLTGRRRERIGLTTPQGLYLDLEVREIVLGPWSVSCAVAKDAGDDPDVTDGALIFAEAAYADAPGVTVEGGKGVGRVTQPGLDQPVGAAAINSVPRRMIRENVEEVCRAADYRGGLAVTISVPAGEALAKKTFNPRLGIEGGISILGTTGIVEPMSETALVETIHVELRQRRAAGEETALLTPGNYGSDFIRESLAIDMARAVQISNFIGDSLDLCREAGFRRCLLVGHIGKMVKLAGGMLNTHSKYGDCRMEILAAHAAALGLSPAGAEAVLACVACDAALEVLRGEGLLEPVMARLTDRAWEALRRRAGDTLETGLIVYSKEYGLLGQSENAASLLRDVREE